MEFTINTRKRTEMIDITDKVQDLVSGDGMVFIFVPHTTAGITINENADPDVKTDILKKLEEIVPKDDDYLHAEGNSDAHIKASLMGSNVCVIIKEGRLSLGTWQSIFFCEFDGPRTRKIIINLV